MSCALLSNGVLVESRVQEIRRINALVLSLDGIGEANDLVRGQGVFEAVMSAIRSARRVGIPVKLNAVVSASTLPGLDALLTFAEEQDLCLTINPMRWGAQDLWHQAERIKVDDRELRQVLTRLAGLARTKRRLLYTEPTYRYSARWPDYTHDRLEADALPEGHPLRRSGPRCQAGRAYLLVDSDGSVAPCAVAAQRIRGGNVVADGVAAAWRSLHQHPCVACYAPCWVELNHFFSLEPRVVLNALARNVARYF
jgi:MoaA/NifB/PqqE/SkfB family radical SAM enzyme